MASYKVLCVVTLLTLLTPEFWPQVDAEVCGQVQLNPPNVGGVMTVTDCQWPWIASLRKDGRHVCTGTLVAVDSVLSSADCFSSSSRPSDWTVVLGCSSSSLSVTLNVMDIILSSRAGSNIAVLHLETPPTPSNYIQPICLDNEAFSVGSTCWAAAWTSGQGGVLQETQTSVVDCGNPTGDSICTQAFTLEQGASGGPLICEQGSSWFLAAVLTVDHSSSTQPRAGVMIYTRVNQLHSFLLQGLGSASNTTTTNSTLNNDAGAPAPSSFFLFHLLVFTMCLYVTQ